MNVIPARDHLGNLYPSMTAMAKAYGLTPQNLYHRIQKYDIETALTFHRGKEITDHTGRKFNSVKEMCSFYNLSYKTFKWRRFKGKTLEQALTVPLRTYRHE